MNLKGKENYPVRLVISLRCSKATADKYHNCVKKVNISEMFRDIIDEFCSKEKLNEVDL